MAGKKPPAKRRQKVNPNAMAYALDRFMSLRVKVKLTLAGGEEVTGRVQRLADDPAPVPGCSAAVVMDSGRLVAVREVEGLQRAM